MVQFHFETKIYLFSLLVRTLPFHGIGASSILARDVFVKRMFTFYELRTKFLNKFLIDGKKYNSLSDLQKDLIGIINADEQEKNKTLTIGWNWKYETGSTQQEISANDLIDTKEAKEINSYTFDIVISGTQVTPDN